MTLSADPRKESDIYELHRENKAESEKDEHDLLVTNSDALQDCWVSDSSLHITDLEQIQFLTHKGRSRSSRGPAGQNCSTRKEAARFQDFAHSRNKQSFFLDNGNCESLRTDTFPTGGEEETKKPPDSKYKLEETSIKSVPTKQLAEEDKIRERSRKGRERSLRTRRRNIARLRLLEENCAHFSKENNVLRELARCLNEQETEQTIKLLKQYRLLKEEKPESHKLSQSESYYMNLMSPLSVTASTTPRETGWVIRKATTETLETGNSLIPCTFKGLPTRQGSRDPNRTYTLQDIDTCHAQMSTQEASLVSIRGEKKSSPTGTFHSVFADPANCDEKEFGLNIEDIYGQPPLSAEEICHLLEEEKGLEDLLRL